MSFGRKPLCFFGLWLCLASQALAQPSLDPQPEHRASYRVEAIDILGNTRTQRSFILGHLRIKSGDKLSEERVEESRLALLGSGLFRQVTMRLRRGTQRGRVVLVVELEEQNTLIIDRLYLGASEVAPFFGAFGLAETNLFGEGITLAGHLAFGQSQSAGQVELFIPKLGFSALQLMGSLSHINGSESLNPRDPTGRQMHYRRFGGTFGLGLVTGPTQRISLIYRLESVSVDPMPLASPEERARAPSIHIDESGLSTLSAGWEHNTENDGLFPTRGHRIRLGVELSTRLLGSDYEYSKYTLSLSQAFRGFWDHSLRVGLFAGYIQGQAPFFDQFFLSDFAYFVWGQTGLRRAVDLNFSGISDYDDAILSLTLEYYLPLGGLGQLGRLYLFVGGNLATTGSLQEIQKDDPKAAPRFPLSFDLGLKFDTEIGLFTLSGAYLLSGL